MNSDKCKMKVKHRFHLLLQGSHNQRKFPQIYAVSVGVVLVIMKMHYFQKFIVASFLTTLPLRNMDMEISCESIVLHVGQ